MPNRRNVRTEIQIPVKMENSGRPCVPPSQQMQPPSPLRYQGSAIPSRSFRMLQMMTGEDDNRQNSKIYGSGPHGTDF